MTHFRKNRDDIIHDIKKRLETDYKFKRAGDWYRSGVCPGCGKRELYTHAKEPWVIKCGRLNHCGWEENVKALYPEAYENLNEKYIASSDDPNATADAYMDFVRGFPRKDIKGWYRQGVYKNPNANKPTATVIFDIDRKAGISMERFVETIQIKNADGDWEPRKQTFKGKYRGLVWRPPVTEIKAGDHVWIVEACIDAISLQLSGVQAVAILSCTNFPRTWLDSLPKNVTLIWALDNDNAGRAAIKKHVKEARKMGFECRAGLVPDKRNKGKFDWNEAYNMGKITPDFLENICLYHGALFLAQSAFEKAMITWQKRHQNNFAIEFDNRIFWFGLDVDKFSKEMESLRIGSPDTPDKELSQKAAKNSGSVVEIANCHFQFLYYQANKLTDESWYYARISFPHGGKPQQNTFSGAQIASSSEFKKRLLSIAAGALWSGTGQQLDWVVKNYLDNIKVVETVDFVGYAKEHQAYIFENVCIRKGKVYPLNDEDFFEIGRLSVKSLQRAIGLNISDSLKGHNTDWPDWIWEAFGPKGIISLAFFFGSLFAEQIREKHKSFPFLEVVGEAGAGKSTLLEFLWKLLGRNEYEGFDPNKSTMAARSRMMSQTSNMPVCFIESDRSDTAKQKAFDWDELKTAYNGRPVAFRGVKTGGNETYEPPFRGSIVISQNDPVNGSIPIMQRIIHLFFDRAEHTHKGQMAADHLSSTPVEELSHFLLLACRAEERILKRYESQFHIHEKRLQKITDIKITRLEKNHAQLMALVDGLADLIKLPTSRVEEVHNTIEQLAINRQKAIGADHPVVEQFWETFDYLDGKRPMDHSADPAIIAVNLNHFREVAMEAKQDIAPRSELLKHLKTSKHRKYIDTKTVRSDIWKNEQGNLAEQRSVKCWIFKRENF